MLEPTSKVYTKMCTNAGTCLVSQSQKIASIHYHQQTKDHKLLSKGPRFPYPGYTIIADAMPVQYGPVKTWQVAACERGYQ